MHVDLQKASTFKKSITIRCPPRVVEFQSFVFSSEACTTPEPTFFRQVPPLHEKRTRPQIEQGPLCAACNPAKTMQNHSRLQHWLVIKLFLSGMFRTDLLAARCTVRPKTLNKNRTRILQASNLEKVRNFHMCLSIRFILRIHQMHRCHWHTSVTCQHVQRSQQCTNLE